ncbi:class I SAM-dependent methyltransferase [Bacillus cereus group sp. TH177-1LC]|uniref:class I SAM-dependent methyltransferase n=1 Tax=Bacillus cereus group sp. TH177-1LC TaxID=3018055 RepID=UPI0022DFC07A|nr:rRNA adenine N-6-methyltransferase family protein [Bacillus cereus group sp. TH177-1LC]MDA1640774.1 SAM-dependent methyltransferase [Bacillus cereus group sp. TH177-1LC]
MNVIRFIQEYMKQPRMVGVILPSSKQLAKQMVSSICFKKAKCIIEFGPKTGIFTEELIKRKYPGTILLLIEENEAFYQELSEKYMRNENVYIIHDSAENVNCYVEGYKIQKIHYIVSGLPFASLPFKVSKNSLQQTKNILGEEGTFITFQYAKLKQQLFSSFFANIKLEKVYWNIPPAYVFTCKIKLNNK